MVQLFVLLLQVSQLRFHLFQLLQVDLHGINFLHRLVLVVQVVIVQLLVLLRLVLNDILQVIDL